MRDAGRWFCLNVEGMCTALLQARGIMNSAWKECCESEGRVGPWELSAFGNTTKLTSYE